LHGLIDRTFLFHRQGTTFPLGKLPEYERPDGHPHQPQHVYFKMFQHPSNVAILAFIQHNF
jgi:hypothetical protein